jgi:hypothetical protein
MPFALPSRLFLAITTLGLFQSACGPGRAQQRSQELARTRPALVRVMARYATAQARPEGCQVKVVDKEPGAGARMRKLADLEVTGAGLDRARAEPLLTAKACALGGEQLLISDEDYGSGDERGSAEATVYGFDTPVQILPSGLDVDAEPRPLDCRVLFFRTQRPEAPYDELAGLHLNIPELRTPFKSRTGASQAQALKDLQQAACHLGADAIIVLTEQYDVPGIGTRVSGTAILFRESRKGRPKPGGQEL